MLRLNRRIHLYTALFLAPWFLMYGVSSIPFNHSSYFEDRDLAKKQPLWKKIGERSNFEFPEAATENLKGLAERIVRETGLSGSYGAYRQSPQRIDVYTYTFWKSVQVKCFVEEKRLVIEERRFRWDHFFTGMHAKGGFEMDGASDAWGIVVDLVAASMALWVVTGLVMWWGAPATRRWGWLAIGSGMASFVIFIWRL